MNRPWFQPFLAEAIGTFGLIFFGAGSIVMNEFTGGGVGLVGIALAHGVVLAVVITATAHISGGHINPAVTIGAWIGRAIDSRMAVVYIGAQLLGAVVAASLLAGLYPEAAASAANLGTPMLADGVSVSTGIMIEAILTFFLVFTVFGTAIDSRAPNLGGWAIGLVLVFDILAGGPLTGASMTVRPWWAGTGRITSCTGWVRSSAGSWRRVCTADCSCRGLMPRTRLWLRRSDGAIRGAHANHRGALRAARQGPAVSHPFGLPDDVAPVLQQPVIRGNGRQGPVQELVDATFQVQDRVELHRIQSIRIAHEEAIRALHQVERFLSSSEIQQRPDVGVDPRYAT